MKRSLLSCWLLFVLVAVGGLNAMAQEVVTYVTIERMAGVFREMDADAELTMDERDVPVWQLSRRGVLLTITCYDRQSVDRYGSLLFYAGWQTSRTVPLAEINAWNRMARFGRAYIDEEGDPVLELDLLAAGGITEETIKAVIDVFVDSVLDLDAVIASYF